MANVNKVLDELKNKLADLIVENAILKAEVEELSGKATGNNEIKIQEATTESD